MKPRLLILLSFSLAGSIVSVAQTPPNLDQLQAKERLNAKLREEEEQRKLASEIKLQQGIERGSRAKADGATFFFSSENDLPATERQLLLADISETQKYSELLRQPNTGFFKLLNYQETKAAVSDAKSRFAYPRIRGGGTFYSFSKRNHLADEWAQLHLQDGVLQPAYAEMKRTTVVNSGGVQQSFVYTSGYSLALLTTVGNVPLEAISWQDAAVQPLADLQPPTSYTDFVTRLKQYSLGITQATQRYQSSLPASLDLTYVMRSINYQKADVIVAFRIVQQDRDGNLHILWKLLKSFSPPQIKGKKP